MSNFEQASLPPSPPAGLALSPFSFDSSPQAFDDETPLETTDTPLTEVTLPLTPASAQPEKPTIVIPDSHPEDGACYLEVKPTDPGALSISSATASPRGLTPSNRSITEPPSPLNISDVIKNMPPQNYGRRSVRRRKIIAESGLEDVVQLLVSNLPGREQFFFIDDSTSMKPHKAEVREVFRAISCVAEELDPNAMELAFASNAGKIHRARHFGTLCKKLARHEFRRDPALMHRCFGRFVNHCIIKKLPLRWMGYNLNFWARRDTSFYIFTDGRWGTDREPRSACGVAKPIERLMAEMKRRNLDKSEVNLHFVRFGDDEEGKRNLDFLDKFGKQYDW